MLEALYRVWSSQAACPKYHLLTTALHAACGNIDEYYGKTTESPAYILYCVPTMLLIYFCSSSQSGGENGLFQKALAS